MVTRAELAAQRAAGTSQEGRLAALRTQRTVGLSVDDLESVRLQRVEAKAMEAFNASTLLEAQEAIGAAVPGIVTSITLDSDFDSPTGSSPQTTATRTLNIPAGNPGKLYPEAEITGVVILQKNLAGAGFSVSGSGDLMDATDTETLAFRINSGTGAIIIQLRDATTGASIGSPFTITTT